MARRYYTLRYFKNFDCFFICLLVGNLCLCNIMHEFYFLIYLYVRNFDYLCRPKRKCGEIWLLATTLKNAKMLTTMVIEAMMTAFISMFCVFVTAPHFCGAFVFMPRCHLSPADVFHQNGAFRGGTALKQRFVHQNRHFCGQTA